MQVAPTDCSCLAHLFLCSEVVHIEDWCDEIVLRFAVQALINAVGPEAVRAWLAEQSSRSGVTVSETAEAEAEEEVMEVNAAEAQDAELYAVSLAPAAEEYFSDEAARAQFPTVGVAEREGYSKRAVQLLSQLCVVHPPLLAAIPQVYSAWVASGGASGAGQETVVKEEGGASAAETGDEAGEVGAGVENDQREPGSEGGDGEDGEGQVVAPAAAGRGVFVTLQLVSCLAYSIMVVIL